VSCGQLAGGGSGSGARSSRAVFLRAVMVLQRDYQALDRPQRRKRHQEDQRQPKHGMQPIGRLVDHLGDQSRGDDNCAADHNDEHRRTIAGIGEVEVETASLAAWPQCQKALEQPAFAAARAAAAQAAGDWQRLLRHSLRSFRKAKGRRV
jgi:hypothetical protein